MTSNPSSWPCSITRERSFLTLPRRSTSSWSPGWRTMMGAAAACPTDRPGPGRGAARTVACDREHQPLPHPGMPGDHRGSGRLRARRRKRVLRDLPAARCQGVSKAASGLTGSPAPANRSSSTGSGDKGRSVVRGFRRLGRRVSVLATSAAMPASDRACCSWSWSYSTSVCR